MKKYHYNCPKGLTDGYETIFLDDFCRWQCFKGYGACPSTFERQVINIPEIIIQIQGILRKKPEAKIHLKAPNFLGDLETKKVIPREVESQHIKLLKAIIEKGIQTYFCIETTVYSLVDRESDFYHFLREAGIQEVWLGVESGSKKLRDKYNKPPFTNQQLEKITHRMQKQDLFCCWYLVVGFEDSGYTIRKTVDLIKKVKPDRIFLFQLVPYKPGEQYIDLKIVKGKISEIEKYQKTLQDLSEKIDREKH